MSTTVVGNVQQVIQMTPAAEKAQDMSHQLINVAAQQKDEDRAIEDELRLTEVQDPSETNEITETDPDDSKKDQRSSKNRRKKVEEGSSGPNSVEQNPSVPINENAGNKIDLVV